MILHLLLLVITLSYFKFSLANSSSSTVFQAQAPLGIPWQGPPVTLSKQLYNTSDIPFEEHNSGIPWLGMKLNFDHVLPLLNAINTTDQPLISRMEAHITVISPPEYAVLSKEANNITMDRLNDLAKDSHIQASEFKVVCLGRVMQQNDVVYQLIVSSPALVKLRERIFRLYYSSNGNPSLFDPHSYLPHITVGFTDHDLFTEQGIYKGLNACFRPVTFIH